MGTEFDAIFKGVVKDSAKDPNASLFKAGDISIKSYIPWAIPSGLPELDFNIGRPGWPAGRVVELYGFEHCTAYDTFVQFSVRTPEGKVQNSKGGTIENLYHRFHQIPKDGKGGYLRSQTKDAVYFAPSIDENNTIIQNQIIDVVKTGESKCFEVTTKTGLKVRTTSGHKFFTGEGYVELSSLKVGDTIFIHNKARYTVEEQKKQEARQSYYVNNHPFFSKQKGIRKYRAIYEAFANGITLDEYLQRLEENDLEDLKFLDNKLHIHHIDGDHTNNKVENLIALTESDHRRHHAKHSRKNLGFIAVPDEIVSIVSIGTKRTYDLKMKAPYHNYVADGFVVHNCGKTTLAYHAIANAQKMGGSGVFIDTEKSWDEYRAEQIGINVDDNFGIIDADSVDAVFRMIQRTLKHRSANNDGKPFVIVVDSVTGAATEEMHAKEIGSAERVGQDAKAIRGGMRRVTPEVAATNTTLIMVNHATANITANKYAKQSDSSGGHSIKLAATVRCAMKGSGWIKDEENTDRRFGQKVSIKIEKLKNSALAYPEIKDTPLLNTTGFDMEASLLEAGKKSGWIEHKPSAKFYTFEGENFARSDWPSMVMRMGGPDKAYRKFLEWCQEEGSITPWGHC